MIGREPGKQLIATYTHAFPDTTLTIDLLVAEADTVAAFVSYHSTHTGPFIGYPPTGKPVRVTGMDSMRYRDGQVIELSKSNLTISACCSNWGSSPGLRNSSLWHDCGARAPFSQRVPVAMLLQ